MKKLVLITGALTLLLFIAVTGCKRGDDGAPAQYNITFWNDQASAGNIIVTVDSTQVNTITSKSIATACNTSGCANFSLAAGIHTYKAVTATGEVLNGSFSLNQNCTLIKLQATEPVTTGNLTVWNTDLAVDIVVTVDNSLNASITQHTQAYSCNAGGSANFLLEQGSHTLTARSTNGNFNWGPLNVTITAGQCKLFELYR